ncbi:MAG: YciI family protein [Bacteroidota bacterium]
MMRKASLFFSALSVLVMIACNSQTTNPPPTTSSADENVTGYDSIKATKYGADDYGMRKYVMAFLKKGPNRPADSVKAAELQAAHMANISRMAQEGKLALAGPFFGDGELRGIYIFNVESIAEAEALTNSDPAIKAGSLIMELKEWYGSAGVMAINEIHDSLAKKKM